MGLIKLKLSLLGFLEFAIWGSYLTSMGSFLANSGFAESIGWFYAMQGIVSLFMPSIVGIIADRWIPAQKMLSLCHLLGGLFMGSAGLYCLINHQIHLAPLFTLYSLSVAFFMPTIGLNNSVAFNALNKAGLDTVKAFPPIRIWGTIGFIYAMLFVNFMSFEGVSFQNSYWQFITSAVISLLMAAYSITMPNCPTSQANANASMAEKLGLKAFTLFKQKKMAVFFLFSMLLGVSLQITNGYANTYIQSFKGIAEYAGAWAAENANAIIAISQCSETLCILLIPYCLKRFGIKGVMLMSMFAWVLRFGLFGAGNPADGVWMLVLSCIVYGIAFDFFNVSGGLYVDQETSPEIRSSAQGLFMIMTNGFGATIGTLSAMFIVNAHVDFKASPEVQLEGWRECWYIFAAYALVVALLFMFIFKDNNSKANASEVIADEEDPAGFIS